MYKILNKPFYLILLPIFFVLHGYLENFGFISFQNAILLSFLYTGFTLCIYLISYLFFKDHKKATLITFIWMAFFFFFPVFHEFLKIKSPVKLVSRYSFLITVSVCCLILLFCFIKKASIYFYRFNLFLNVLLLLCIAVDLLGISWKLLNPRGTPLDVYGFDKKTDFTTCDTCAKPDIYFLLFDEYASTISLKEQYNCDNNIDSLLISKGFSIQEQSHSNYNFTPFSISSILNMAYITGIKDLKSVSAKDYSNSTLLIRDNHVISFLDAHGYSIINYSVFDLAGHPSTINQSYLPLKTKLITDRTLFAHLNKDIGWMLKARFPFNLFTSYHYLKHLHNNNLFSKLVKEVSAEESNTPRFIYAHFYMPHPPFYFDREGKRKNYKTIIQEYYTATPSAYCDYLVYTNQELMALVNSIQNNDPSAVIIIMGDHGLRGNTKNPYPYHFFQNLNAVYYKDKNYGLLYDSISGVNQFRVVFNKLFQQSFPLLNDTSILLRDKPRVSGKH